jgi:hypothetical protein
MQASHDWSQQSSVKETLRIWIDRRAPDPAPTSQQVTLSVAAQEKQSGEAAAINDAVSKVENDPRLQLLILMVEKMTGLKIKVFDAGQIKAPETVSVPIPNVAQPRQPTPRAGFGVEYSKVASYSESEQTTMQAAGVIKTSDGKEIKFSLDLIMQRQYSQTSSTNVRLGDAARKTDPLIINFNGTAAQLSEQRFAFDLNSDGKNEQISAPLSGSGFLALDKNGDGKINNGGELFGPVTGNGFSELAKYDNDGNGWIDESDPVFKQLKMWTMGAAGNNQLSDLASLGVGAISLHSIATPFDIKTASNQLLGSIQASSIYINESGSAGSVQQVDLTV